MRRIEMFSVEMHRAITNARNIELVMKADSQIDKALDIAEKISLIERLEILKKEYFFLQKEYSKLETKFFLIPSLMISERNITSMV